MVVASQQDQMLIKNMILLIMPLYGTPTNSIIPDQFIF